MLTVVSIIVITTGLIIYNTIIIVRGRSEALTNGEIKQAKKFIAEDESYIDQDKSI